MPPETSIATEHITSPKGNDFHAIMDEFRGMAPVEREKGNYFEKLMVGYLKADPTYQTIFKDVWLWNEWAERHGKAMGHIGLDTGVDLVAEEVEGGWCAIQCKFHEQDHRLDLPELGAFFTTLGKKPFTSGLIVSTADDWTNHAEAALDGQTKTVNRIRIQDLQSSPVDWTQFHWAKPQEIKLQPKKRLRRHQTEALAKVEEGFQSHDRGKLIMACGTGKTFTALKIAEKMAGNGRVLFLAPSISLVNQTIREWAAEAEAKIHGFAVCSDSKVGKRGENEDISVHDLAYPATTDPARLAQHFKGHDGEKKLTVIFSTYQSISVIHGAQTKYGLPGFDLIICDEAHRTTGATLAGEEESHFVKVHDAAFIKSGKRLYMTATPRIYAESTKKKAEENDVAVYSMDDDAFYGPEFHRLGFSAALGEGILVDYKVLVLAVDEGYVSRTLQNSLIDKNNELDLPDAAKIIGCWNGLSKRVAQEDKDMMKDDHGPMKRAVAFVRSIKDSKRLVALFASTVEEYRRNSASGDGLLACEVEHVDGSMNSLERGKKLDWLNAGGEGTTCRILSNARCLTEGVDVPALDAVMFLNPRNSVVDVVQSVGRVMRKAEGKKYGYIILPIGIPAGIAPEEALQDNEKYRVVWQVLQALWAHDDRFNAMVDKLDLNKTRPDNLMVVGAGGGMDENESSLAFPQLEKLRNAIYAKVVKKCGARRYEDWAKDVLGPDATPEARAAFDRVARADRYLRSVGEKLNEAMGSFAFDRALAEKYGQDSAPATGAEKRLYREILSSGMGVDAIVSVHGRHVAIGMAEHLESAGARAVAADLRKAVWRSDRANRDDLT